MLFLQQFNSFSHNSMYSMHYTYYSLGLSGLLSTFFMISFLFLSECFMFNYSFNSKYNLVIFSLLCLYLHNDSSFFLCSIIFMFFIYLLFISSFNMSFSLLLLLNICFVPLRYTLFIYNLLMLAFFLFMWINDFITECSFSFTSTEQSSLIYGMKLLILSEFMLFICVFWTQMNFSFMLNVFSCFYILPLLSSFCFAMPYSNVIILLFSSLPIQATMMFYKVGLLFCSIEQLGQTVSCGTVFLVLQLKEFFCSLHSMTDCMIGSIFYFTTSLHGAHVMLGLFYFYSMLMLYSFAMTSFSLQNIIMYNSISSYIMFMSLLVNMCFMSTPMFNKNKLFSKYMYIYTYTFIEFSESLFYSSYYWHFVDIIWLIVFLLYFY